MSIDPVSTFTVGRFTVEIIPDHDAESPAEWADKDGVFLVADARRYFTPENPLNIRPDDVAGEDGDESSYAADYWIFPLFAYIHSGIALSLGAFGCRWDSGQIGYVLVKRSEHWSTEAAAMAAAGSVVAEWNQYLSGDVYGYRVLDADGDDVDSCWGFYGETDAESEGRAAAVYQETKACKVDHGRELFDPILFGA
jgi:hypothetical protein